MALIIIYQWFWTILHIIYTRDSHNCHKAISLKSSPYQWSLQVINVFQRPPICLVKMSGQDVSSKFLIKCLVKMRHQNVSFCTLCTFNHHPCMYTFCTFCTFCTFFHHPSSIIHQCIHSVLSVHSSIIHHPSMYTFCKTVKNGQKRSKRSKTVKAVQNGHKQSNRV